MEYMGDKGYWESKFANRSDTPLNPEQSIIDNLEYFKRGTVLDIACGDGRNALFLLENGFKVTGVDFSINALERLRRFAKEKNYSVDTKQIDLSIPASLNDIGMFDNVIVNHYRLNKEQLEVIEDHITEAGILFVNGFGYKHKVDSKIRKEDLIQPGDFEDLKDHFELVKYLEDEDERGFFVTYIFCKRKN